jgi:putative two-component system response regulator
MHLAALRSIASSIGVAALEQLRRAERDAAQEATILALARLAEHRDNETAKHLERVSRFCRLIAEGLRQDLRDELQIEDGWIRDVERSAPLHDIGKVGIPDSILMKPGPLTDGEWAIMKTHTLIGADTLRGVIERSTPQPFLQIGLEMARDHHEKWDGTGYPRGLAGEQIPLSARILALADVYDALTSARPYKQPWTHEQALERIRADRGSHFDPRVADAFLARAERVDRIRSRLADGPEDLLRLQRRLA